MKCCPQEEVADGSLNSDPNGSAVPKPTVSPSLSLMADTRIWSYDHVLYPYMVT